MNDKKAVRIACKGVATIKDFSLRMNQKTIKITCEGSSHLPYSKLTDFQGELKTLSKENFERLRKEILELGFSEPVSVWQNGGKNYILNGHQRTKTVAHLVEKEGYICPDLPVSIVHAKDIKEAKLKVLALTSQFGTIESQGLYEFMSEANITFSDIESTFNFPNIDFKQFNDEFFTDPASDKDDDIPDPGKTDIKLGDMFILGDHRLLAGDATKAEDVAKLMGKEKADMVFTDPPYGIDYGAKNRFLNSFQPSGRNLKDIANDMLGKDELLDMLVKAFTLAYEYGKDCCSYYVTAPQGGELGLMMMMMMMSNLPVRHVLIWNKNSQNFSLGRLDYEYKHEPILFTWKKTHQFYGNGEHKNSVWDISKERKCAAHPTMKPVALMENALLNSSKMGDVCLDPFGGSGSTLIACQKTKRKCRMMEVDLSYCQVIVTRWESFTGRKATKCDQKR